MNFEINYLMLRVIIRTIAPLHATSINKLNLSCLTSWKGEKCTGHTSQSENKVWTVKSKVIYFSRIRSILLLRNTLSDNITTFFFWTQQAHMWYNLFLFRLNDFLQNTFCKSNKHTVQIKTKPNLLLHFLLFLIYNHLSKLSKSIILCERKMPDLVRFAIPILLKITTFVILFSHKIEHFSA